jgi:hypothetical protein
LGFHGRSILAPHAFRLRLAQGARFSSWQSKNNARGPFK